MLTNICVIVDGYGAAQPFSKRFKELGYACIHIKSNSALDPIYRGRFNPDDYILTINYDGNLEALVAQLSQYNLYCIIPGMEAGVLLADTLSERFSLFSNGASLSAARRNKYLMHETLRANQIPAIEQFKSSQLEKIVEWVKRELTWPIIIKPLDSAGIDGVTLCRNEEEVREAYYKIINKVNLMGETNVEVLAQEFITGDEFIVNSVSWNGKHFVTEIWQSNKIYVEGIGLIYDKDILLPFDGPIQKELIPYMNNVLTALGIKYGPSHAEVKYNEKGPMLIEVAARVSGGVNVTANNASLGHNQISLTVDAYTDTKRFLDYAATISKIKKNCWQIIAPSRQEGIVQAMPFVKEIEKLPSLCCANYRIKPGDKLRVTRDLNSCIGGIFLVHDDQEVISADYEKIMRLVPEGFILESPTQEYDSSHTYRRKCS